MDLAEQNRRLFFENAADCYWNPKIKIDVLPNGDRTVVAIADLHPDEPLAVVRDGMNLNHKTVAAYSSYPLETLPERLQLAAYLYQYYTELTHQYPVDFNLYFDVLPTYEWYAMHHETVKLYLALNSKQRKELEDSIHLFADIDHLHQWAKGLDKHKVNAEQVIRCVLIAATRCWNVFGMVPWLDFFNHRDDGSLLSSTGNSLHASKFYKTGEEIGVCYGSKDSMDILMVYGCCVEPRTIQFEFPEISPYALCADQELRENFSQEGTQTFLLREDLDNLGLMIKYLRLAVFNCLDLLAVTADQPFTPSYCNTDNEKRATQHALECIESKIKRYHALEQTLKQMGLAHTNAFLQELICKQQILETAKNTLCIHWIDLLVKPCQSVLS